MKIPKLCGESLFGGRCVLIVILSVLLLNFTINYLFIHFGGFAMSFAEASGNITKSYALLKDRPAGFIMSFRNEYVAGRGKDHFGEDTANVKADIYNFYNAGGKVVYVSGSADNKTFRVYPSYIVLNKLCEDTAEEIFLDNDVSKRLNIIKNMSDFGLNSIGLRDYLFRFLYVHTEYTMTPEDAANRLAESKIKCLKSLKDTEAANKEYDKKMKDPQFRKEQKALIDSVIEDMRQ